MSIRKPLFGFSLFAIFALFLTFIIWSTLVKAVPGKTNSFITYFTDASGLAEGDDVRMAGVRVGRVETIKLENNKAKVKFIVEKDQKILLDTQAAIRYQNLIGQRYIGLSRTTSNIPVELKSGSTLKVIAEDSFDVSELLNGFQPVFDVLKPEEVNKLSESIIQTLQGDNVALTYTLSEIGRMAQYFGNRDEVLGSIIDNLGLTMREFSLQGKQLESFIQNASVMVTKLNGNSVAFGTAMQQISLSTSKLGNVLAQLRPSAEHLGGELTTAVNKMVGAGKSLDRLAVTAPKFLDTLAQVTSEGSWLNVHICDLDITFGGVLFPPGLVNKIGGNQFSEVCRTKK